MRISAAFLVVAPLVGAAAALRGSPCFEACQMVLRPIKFNDTAGLSPSPPTRQCQSHKALVSLYLCAKVYCSVEEETTGLQFLNSTCQKKVHDSVPPFDLIADYTDELIAHVPRYEKPDWDDGVTFQDVVIPSDHFILLAYDTLYSWSYAYRYHFVYGGAMFVFWGIVVAIGLLNRVLLSLRYKTSRRTERSEYAPLRVSEYDGPPPFRTSRLGSLGIWLKARLIVPAAFGYRKAQPFGWYTVPPRIESLTILSFIILNIVFTVHGYHIFSDNLYYPDMLSQLLRYVSDRTGIIAFANFPLVWLFGMRNNILLWLTGWDFGTYNNFHRWVARVATVQAVIHSIGYTILVIYENGIAQFLAYWNELWWTTGELATIFMCALLPLSLYWMRRNMYEGFLIIHIVLSIIVLATMWGHIYPFKSQPWDSIIWISCSIWAIDRASRMLRTLCFSRKVWNTRAQATYDRDANIIRLRIPTSQSWYQPRRGTFYYLHLLEDRRFWESHPFTMSSFRRGCQTGAALLGRTSIDSAEAAGLLSGDVEVESVKSDATHPEKSTMDFIIRPYDSFTLRLARAAERASPLPSSLRVLVEGPYGHTQPLHRYSNILFIVGGSGIVAALVHLRELCEAGNQTKNIHIVWAVREAAFASSVLREDMSDLHESGKLSLDIYVTTHGELPILENFPKTVREHLGRPDVYEEVDNAVHQSGRSGSLAVVACGPAKMADEARKAVVDTLGTDPSRQSSNFSVDYFEEAFNW
ncbi:putative FAD-binding FR-type domain-containing protein [Seiridium unicorne]|uniref:FAD-binding FR-type domain-containing protein n=1 Tax=Seiridium unicorne TaxID=138068 RepID=A0ABR2VEC1_9PEZI